MNENYDRLNTLYNDLDGLVSIIKSDIEMLQFNVGNMKFVNPRIKIMIHQLRGTLDSLEEMVDTVQESE